jgi:hypothetical protein
MKHQKQVQQIAQALELYDDFIEDGMDELDNDDFTPIHSKKGKRVNDHTNIVNNIIILNLSFKIKRTLILKHFF